MWQQVKADTITWLNSTLHRASTTNVHCTQCVSAAAFTLSLGYALGNIARTLSSTRATPRLSLKSSNKNPVESMEPSGSDSESDTDSGDLADIKLSPSEECRMVLIVRTDLGMSLGKIAAQTSHAALACYKALHASNPSMLSRWENTGQKQLALCCNDEETLLLLQAQAQSLNLCARTIQDAGRTQIAAGSRTVLGIGPGPERLIKPIVQDLPPL